MTACRSGRFFIGQGKKRSGMIDTLAKTREVDPVDRSEVEKRDGSIKSEETRNRMGEPKTRM